MNAIALQVLGGLLSAAVHMISTIIILFCVINFFTLKPGGSKKFVFVGLFYFFSSLVVLLGSAQMLMSSGPLSTINLVGVLLGAALVHFSYGVLLVLLYIGNIASRRL